MAAKVKEQLGEQEREQEEWQARVVEGRQAEALAKEELANLLQLE